MIADGFDGFAVHLANHDVTLTAVSRAPLAKLLAYRKRMGWSFPWASSQGGDFNFNFNVSFTEQRSEEHTSELQSLMRISYAVFCLKKKTNNIHRPKHTVNINKPYLT